MSLPKNFYMYAFEMWFLKLIIRKLVVQGDHVVRITMLYTLIRTEAERTFYEDNVITLNSNLRYWFEDSLRKITK